MATWTISEVSAAVGVSPQTLRVWEAKGLLLPERTAGGQRRYSDDDVQRATRIVELRRTSGWNPAAIKVSLGDSGASAAGRPWSGATARQARLARGWSIKETAERARISAPYLSSIERGETGGSTRVIAQLADAFGLPMSGLGRFRSSDTTVVRGAERARGEFDGGVVWEELVLPGHQFEPAMLTVPARQSSGGSYSRPGESFALLLAGSLCFEIADSDPVTVGKGDSIVIPAAVTFAWVNPGRGTARAVWVEQLPAGAWASPEAASLIQRVRHRTTSNRSAGT